MIIAWSYGAVASDPMFFDLNVGPTGLSTVGSIPPPAPSASASGFISLSLTVNNRGLGKEDFCFSYLRPVNQGMGIPASPSVMMGMDGISWLDPLWLGDAEEQEQLVCASEL